MENVENVDIYLNKYSGLIRERLDKIRSIIRESVPDAQETIGYGMPTYKLNGNLVHFAANKNHLGFYPTPSAIEYFREKLTGYKTSKGAIQFLYNKEMPEELIREIVLYRAAENRIKK